MLPGALNGAIFFLPLGQKGRREEESAECDLLLVQTVRKELISSEALGELNTGAQIHSDFASLPWSLRNLQSHVSIHFSSQEENLLSALSRQQSICAGVSHPASTEQGRTREGLFTIGVSHVTSNSPLLSLSRFRQP